MLQVKSKEDFTSYVIQNSKLAFVDFYADWCGPCRMIAPALEKIAAKHADKVDVVKVNTDEFGAIAAGYGVEAIPNMVLFKDGQPVDRIVGLVQEDAISEMLERHF